MEMTVKTMAWHLLLLIILLGCNGSGQEAVDEYLGLGVFNNEGAGVIGNSSFSFTQASKAFPITAVSSTSAYIEITVTNISSVDVFIGGLNISDSANFGVQSQNCIVGPPILYTPGSSCTVRLVFNPSTPGPHITSLNILYGNDGGAVTQFTASEVYSGIATSSIGFSGITSADTITHRSANAYWVANVGAVSYQVFNWDGATETLLANIANPVLSSTTVPLQPGTNYTLRVRATDIYGGVDTNTAEIPITTAPNIDPLIVAIPNITTYGGRAVAAIDATDANSGVDVDAQNDVITYVCRYDNAIDGTVLDTSNQCSTLFNQGGGNPTFDSATGIFTGWIPRNMDVGTQFEFKITATDPYGGSDTELFSTTVQPGVDIVTAIADASIAENTNHIVPFVILDSNLNADCNATYLSMSSSNTALVPNANVVWSGSYPNCVATISPAANAFGVTTLTFTLAEGLALDTEDFVLTVNNINAAPTMTTIANQSTAEDTTVQITYADLLVAADENDIDGDPLSFRLMSLNSGTLSYSGGAITYGTTTIGIGEWVDWTPPANQNNVTNAGALNAFDLRVTDGVLDSVGNVSLSVDVTAVNDAPTLSTITPFTTDEDLAIVITHADLLAASDDADIEGATVSFRLMNLSTGSLAYSAGAITYGTTVVSAGQSITWTPPAGENNISNGGTFNPIGIKAYDGALESTTTIPLPINVNAVNDPPVLSPIGDQTIEAGQAITAIDAEDSNTSSDIDQDGTALSYSCYYDTTVDGAVADVLLCTGLSNLSFTPATGQLTWTPYSTLTGAHEFKIRVSDGALTDEEIFVITVNPDVTPPAMPNSLTLLAPGSSPNADTTPTIQADNLTVDDTLSLYAEATCTSTAIGSKTVVAVPDSLDTASLDEGLYTIYAQAEDPAGNTSPCSIGFVSYHVETGNPAAVAISYTGFAGTTDPTESPEFDWPASASTDVDRYEVALGTTSGGNEVAGWTNIGGALIYQFTGLAPLTNCVDYYPSVRIHDLLGNTTISTAASFTYDAVNPADPTVTGTSGLANDRKTPILSWTPAGTPDDCAFSHYEVAVGTATSTDDVIAWTDVGAVTNYQFTGLAAQTLPAQTDLYMNLRAVDTAGNYSNIQSSNAWQTECWRDDYNYCRRVSLTVPTENDEQPVRIELTTSNFDYGNAQMNGDDIRFFIPGTDVYLDYWIERWNNTGDSALWVKIPSVGTATLDIRYGSLDVNEEDKPGVFSYSTEQELFISTVGGGTMQFVSYTPGNTYTFSTNTNEPIAQYATDTVVNGFGVISARGGLEGRVQTVSPNYDTIIPMSFAGTELAYGGTRSPSDNYRLYNPTPTAATVTVTEYNGAGAVIGTPSTFALPSTTFTTYVATGADTVIIDSNIPIVGSVDAGTNDAVPLFPADEELIGIPSNRGILAFTKNGTNATIYRSSGGNLSYTRNKGQRVTFDSAAGANGNSYAVRIVADEPVFAIQQADGDGTDSTSFMPLRLLDDEYLLPGDFEYITIACPYTTTINIYNEFGVGVHTGLCSAVDANRPGLYYYGTSGNAGTRIVGSEVFFMYYEFDNQDETNVIGLKSARPYVVNEPDTAVGTESD
jgi:hypothetical protein